MSSRSGQPDPGQPERGGISRRDFVQGRFWRSFRLNRSTSDSDLGDSNLSDSSQADRPEEAPVKPPRRVPLVMRYPKTLREVGASDLDASPQAEAIPATEARRRTIPVFRPPGAIDEPSFLDGCTRCDECRKACPHDAIVHAPIHTNGRLRGIAGTPIIQADHQACLMCEDFPCIAACEPAVLTSRVPPRMGTAVVTQHLCLAHHGTTCTVCSERCPVENAIEVTEGKPTVNESVCTGCGVCRYVCPAPENAILLMPTFLRPSPTGNPPSE